jgi:hypothetical protein
MYHGVIQNPDREDGKAEEETTSPAVASEPETDERESAKKERVLHTRVPAVLERELKRFAENLRIPVSNLVRTILEDAVMVADAAGDRVETRLRDAARQLESERERLKKKVILDPLAEVFAFQSVSLAQPAECVVCQRQLAAGTPAHLGLVDAPPAGERRPRIFVCDACVPRSP